MSKQATGWRSVSKRSGVQPGLLRRVVSLLLAAWVAWACSGKAGDQDGAGGSSGAANKGGASSSGGANSGGRVNAGGRSSAGGNVNRGGVFNTGAVDAGSAGEENAGGTSRGGSTGTGVGGGSFGNGGASSGGAGSLVPSGWNCETSRYRDGICDCGCGTIDADCPDQSSTSCKRCDAPGSCSKACPGSISENFNGSCKLPTGWTCDRNAYFNGLCDCGCGVLDPDCKDGTAASCHVCDALGSCSLHKCPSIVSADQNWKCSVAEGWTCDANAYGTHDGCDCGCGIVDPDCKDTKATSCEYCGAKGSCSKTCPGSLEPNDNAHCVKPPPAWKCPEYAYGNGICDCGCGIIDVDCASADVSSCQSCGEPGSCTGLDFGCPNNIDRTDNSKCSGPPLGWTCRERFYADGSICNCGCGVPDPDCKDSLRTSCDQCNLQGSCSPQDCPGLIDPVSNFTCAQPTPPKEWKCDASYYGAGWGSTCDCGCGAFDPDCADATIASCNYCAAPGSCSVKDCPGDIDATNNAVCTNHAPVGWTCDPSLYGDQACDCGCGVVDSDCANATVAKCKFCNDTGSCSTAKCPGTISPTNNAVCAGG